MNKKLAHRIKQIISNLRPATGRKGKFGPPQTLDINPLIFPPYFFNGGMNCRRSAFEKRQYHCMTRFRIRLQEKTLKGSA